jgi:sulfopyruvate decarboxylase subunit alpha
MRLDKLNRELFDLKASSDVFAQELDNFSNWVGCIPDSIYKQVLPKLKCWHLAPRENHLIGMAFGAKLGGHKPVVLIQNSGLGLCLDALLGTFCLYNQGLLLIVSNRGILPWEEIQHQDWGRVTEPLLSAIKIKMVYFDLEGIDGLKRAAKMAFENNEVVALIMQRGNLDE